MYKIVDESVHAESYKEMEIFKNFKKILSELKSRLEQLDKSKPVDSEEIGED